MPIKPADFSAFAKKLSNGSLAKADYAHEVTCRAIAGRGYYAAFHAFQSAIREATTDHAFKCDHTKLLRYLKQATTSPLAELAGPFENLQERRHDADYELHLGLDPSKDGLMVGLAEYIVANQPAILAAVVKEPGPLEDRSGFPPRPGRKLR